MAKEDLKNFKEHPSLLPKTGPIIKTNGRRDIDGY
jgi:hypothetical protein